MPTFVDFAGMNTLILSTGSFDENNVIESQVNPEFSLTNSDDELVGINLHRNGPYGYSSWKQLRASENPITRHHKANSTMTFVVQPGPMRNVLPNGELRVRDRYSALYTFTEPAIAQKAYPLVWNVGKHFKDENGNVDLENPERFSIISSYANQGIGFANDEVDKLHKFDPDEEKTEYREIYKLYAEGGLNDQASPLTYWEFLQYRETVFPHMKNQFQNENIERPNFESFYRHNRVDRTKIFETSSFGYHAYTGSSTFFVSQSQWPLDAAEDFLTRTWTSEYELVGKDPGGSYPINSFLERSGEGILQNRYNQYWYDTAYYANPENADSSSVLNGVLGIAPLYSDRSVYGYERQIRNPSGMPLNYIARDTTYASELNFTLEALWEAGDKRHIKNSDGDYVLSPKKPFYDTYEGYIEEARRKYKNFSVVPEFRMSTQVEDYLTNGRAIELDMFDVTGGASNAKNSSESQFYEIYSNSDFMRQFELINEDHKEFTNGKVLSLRCKAVKKFLPYEGFYPCQRTVDLSRQFIKSTEKGITLWDAGQNTPLSSSIYNFVKQQVLRPLYAPGIMFNTIKSGIAVDYPILTQRVVNQPEIRNDRFDARIPFEALLNPKNYLQDIPLRPNNQISPAWTDHPARWDGQSDGLYEKMANNFLAECISFFLQDSSLTTVVSKTQNNIKPLEDGVTYGMRIKMYRSMSGSSNTVYHYNSSSYPYSPPQDLMVTGNFPQETFTMYSSPFAFGPLSRGLSSFDTSSGDAFHTPARQSNNHYVDFTPSSYQQGYEYGFNYPYTPPYYHGEAWCDITVVGSPDLNTIEKIQNACTASFSRFDFSYIESSGAVAEVSSDSGGPQQLGGNLININAVQLSSSLNIFGISRIRNKNSSNLVVDSGLNESNRWTIQTKFETPMLNFNHVSGSDHISYPVQGKKGTPIGMWHQHGRIPEENEGVFIAVNEIPLNYRKVVMNNENIRDLSSILGFSNDAVKIGKINKGKTIYEAVVAVPFIEQEGRKNFFSLDPNMVQAYKDGGESRSALTTGDPQSQIGRSVLNQLQKMEKYIFPPSFDFLNNSIDDVKPIAMYIFEFSHTLNQQDLSDIWQNLPPDIGTTMEESEVAITHPLLKKELLGEGGGQSGNTLIDMPNKLKWMVFKVKQRAASNYFKKTVLRNPEVNTDVESGNVTVDEFGNTGGIQYNWPYDFFSLVELVKLDAEVEFGNFNESDIANYTDSIPPYQGQSADMDKIEYIVGGMGDDITPDNQVGEEYEEEEADVSTPTSPEASDNSEGVFDIPPGVDQADRQYYIMFKGRFTVEANKDPLGRNFNESTGEYYTFSSGQTGWDNLFLRTGDELKAIGQIYDIRKRETKDLIVSWTKRWYNTDPNFQQKKAEAQSNAESVATLNNQVAQNNADRQWRARVKSEFRKLYNDYDTLLRGKDKAKQKAWADIYNKYYQDERWTSSVEVEVYNSIDTGGAGVTLE